MSENTPAAWIAKRLYRVILFFMALTGFGQMPIYNRYYMSDIPGFGWLADFYATRNIHYVGAVLLIGLSSFVVVDFLLSRGRVRLNPNGWVRAALLAALGLSGILVVVKNFPYVHFGDTSIIVLDLFHLAAAMALLAANLACLVSGKKWATVRGVVNAPPNVLTSDEIAGRT